MSDTWFDDLKVGDTVIVSHYAGVTASCRAATVTKRTKTQVTVGGLAYNKYLRPVGSRSYSTQSIRPPEGGGGRAAARRA